MGSKHDPLGFTSTWVVVRSKRQVMHRQVTNASTGHGCQWRAPPGFWL